VQEALGRLLPRALASSGSSWRAATIAISSMLGAGVSGCAVHPSTDCTERAICATNPRLDAGLPSSESGIDAPEEEGGDDAGNEGGGDAPDECVAIGPEDCNNGIDDDCNGAIDCADPTCAGYACAAAAPAGWLGPVALYEDAPAPPACPAGYGIAADSSGGLTAPGADCTCACSASGQSCSAPAAQFYSDVSCSPGSACSTAVSVPSGSCTPVAPCGGASVSFNAPTPAWSGGTCTPMATADAGPWAFTTQARLCSWSGSADIPGGCGLATDQCLKKPTGLFQTSFCIYHVGDPPPSSCPPGAYANRRVYFSSAVDTRQCTTCSCASPPTGGGCSGSIALYSGSTCAGTPAGTLTFGTTACLSLTSPMRALGSYTATVGTCAAASGGVAAGAVQGTGATTVCCM
jgi:hypothetical protein